MGGEHDDDMDLEVNDGLTGELEHYALVEEDLEEREAADAESDRARESRETLQKPQKGVADDG